MRYGLHKSLGRSPRRRTQASKAKGTRYGLSGRRLGIEPLEQRCLLSIGQLPELPGLRPIDLTLDDIRGQIVYLDFDGAAHNVTYNGPVSVGPFDVPSFKAPGELAGQECAIVGQVLGGLNAFFAGVDVQFVTDQPQHDTGYSTIFIGGTDDHFAGYGSFLGVSERSSSATKTNRIMRLSLSTLFSVRPMVGWSSTPATLVMSYRTKLAAFLGYADSNPREDTGPLASLAATYYSAYGQNRTNPVTVTAGSHNFQVDGIAVAKNTEWYVNGSYTGSAQNDWSGWIRPSTRSTRDPSLLGPQQRSRHLSTTTTGTTSSITFGMSRSLTEPTAYAAVRPFVVKRYAD